MEMIDLLLGFAIGFVGAGAAFLLFAIIVFAAWLATLPVEFDERPRKPARPP